MRDWAAIVHDHLDLPALTDRRDQRILGELAAHAEEAYEDAKRQGATDAEAEAAALAVLGSREEALPELVRTERHHAAAEAGRRTVRAEDALREKGSLWTRLADLLMELRLSVRSLGRSPMFTTVVVLVLALGIGATTAIFTLLDRIVLSPLPFPDQDRLVVLGHVSSASGGGDVGSTAAWHLTHLDENRAFQRLGLMSRGGTATVMRGGRPEAVSALDATSGMFATLGMQAVVGRLFSRRDDDPDGPPVVLLGNGYWRERFGADSAVVGTTLQVNGVESEIVGVLPPSFAALGPRPDVVEPLRIRRAGLHVEDIGFVEIARLKDGVSHDGALADMARMLPLSFEKFPGGPAFDYMRQARFAPTVQPLKVVVVGWIANRLWVLMASVALVLGVACANVANLLLVRADGRDKEMAVRAALGASPLRLGWEYLKESLLLGLLGGAAGLGLACCGLRALVASIPGRLPRTEEVSLDATALAFVGAVSVGAALALGALPALRRHRRGLADSLKQGDRSGGYGPRGRLTQNALAVAQIAIALVLLVASGLVLRSVAALHAVDPGFGRSADVLALQLTIPESMLPDDSAATGALMQESIARGLAEVAGVRSVGVGTSLPMHPGGNINPLFVEGVTDPGGQPPAIRRHKWIGEGYFETLGIPLLSGRTLTWQDAHDRAPVAVVSRGVALAYWGSVDSALGKRIAVRPDPMRWHQVVGVVGDVREDALGMDPVPMVYWPQVTLAFWQGTTLDDIHLWRSVSYAVRSDRVGTPGFLEDVQRAIWSVNPRLPLVAVGRLSGFVSQTTAWTRFTLVLVGLAAAVALALGVVGVFGVISYAVSQRTLELGMRMVLGADTRALGALVLRHGVALASAGVALGVGLSLLVTRLLSGLLYGVSPTDRLTLAAAAATLAAVALLAACVPAYRASRVDPMALLRGE